MRFVTVDSRVRLEVLDWGGVGRPVVFVGCYLTAHIYDDIAPKLIDRFHVYAVTRRGIGASDHPAAGYDPERRAADIFEVIDQLEMEKPILVGNSCGGAILHRLGADHADRIGGVMYLEAAEDPTLTMADYNLPPIDSLQLPPRGNFSPPSNCGFPEGERYQIDVWPLDPAMRKAIVEDYNVKPEYARIRVPVVAVYRTTPLEDVLKEYPPRNDQERAAVTRLYTTFGRAMLEKWEGDLRAGVPNAKIVELPRACLYMFLSNPADVIRELRALDDVLGRRSGTK